MICWCVVCEQTKTNRESESERERKLNVKQMSVVVCENIETQRTMDRTREVVEKEMNGIA